MWLSTWVFGLPQSANLLLCATESVFAIGAADLLVVEAGLELVGHDAAQGGRALIALAGLAVACSSASMGLVALV